MTQTNCPLVQIEHLSISFQQKRVVDDVSLRLNRGEILGIVGESGSGKSLTALSILNLLPANATISQASSICFDGCQLINNPDMQTIRGGKVGFVFQEPMSSLNPLHTIEHQIAETIVLHQKTSAKQARRQVLKLLKLTGITNARAKLKAYPHELSGGQRQRAMIAMAIANHPDLLIADEPTTALDVTIQAQIIDLLLKLRTQLGMAIIFISHDLHLIRQIADQVAVMKNGQIVESNTTEQLFSNPQHSYTKTLIKSSNTLKNNRNTSCDTILSAANITVKYPLKRNFWGQVKQWLSAVDNASFELRRGQTLGVVGESGSGKTTLGQAVSQLISHQGTVMINDNNAAEDKNFRRQLQIVFQDPYNSLNPRMNIEQIVGEGLLVHFPKLKREQRRQQVIEIMKEVGLSEQDLAKYPHQFSGGQRQRIALARALILQPQVLILDEPTSALDVTIQAQIIELLQKIQTERQLSYIFISHDMRAIRAMADEIAVMKNGQMIEQGSTEQIFNAPQQEYTRQLIAASI